MSALYPAGTVFVVDTGDNWAAKLIRLGERIGGLPDRHNHVAVMHHYDDAGVPWGIEGRPGGVGWVDLRGYLSRGDTVCNIGQPIPDADRQGVADVMVQLLGTPYDWDAIAAEVFRDLRVPVLFAQNWHGQGIPGHVICSSAAAEAQRRKGFPAPEWQGSERLVEPGDWDAFIAAHGWGTAL